MTFGDFLLYTIWIFWLITIISVFIFVVVDLFHRHDISWVFKALWLLLILVLPVIGMFAYVIFRPAVPYATGEPTTANTGMTPVGEPSTAEQLQILSNLKDNGKLTDGEYQAEKQKLLGPAPRPTVT